jgi:glycerol-3-phosphate acyltransferase PlsY
MIYIQQAFYLFLTVLLSGIPFGLIICKTFKKIDIREHGSKNVGATNVGRVIGKKYAVITFILDGLKSFIPVLLSNLFFSKEFQVLTLGFAVSGHIFSVWLGGRGGKGISSTIVGLLALDYRIALVMIVTWVLVFTTTRISSLAALVSVTVVVSTSYFLSSAWECCILSVMAVIIFWAHGENIKKLLSGNESGFKKNK